MSTVEVEIDSRAGAEFVRRVADLALAAVLQRAVRLSIWLLAVGLMVDVALLAANRGFALEVPRLALLGPPLVLGLVGVAIAYARRPTMEWVMVQADRHLGLQERLITALELRRRGDRGPLARAQVGDALRHLRRVEPSAAFPSRLGRRQAAGLLLPAALLAALILVPANPLGIGQPRGQLDEVIREQAEKVKALADDLEARPPVPETAQSQAEVVQELRRLDRLLRQADGDAGRALASLSAAEQNLSGLENPRGEDLMQAMARLSDALAREEASRQVAEALGRNDPAAAAQNLQSLGQSAAGMSPAQRQSLADALQRAATGASRADGQLNQSLSDAAQALRNGSDPQGALDRAASQLQRAGAQAAAQASLEKALTRLQESRGAVNSAAPSSSQGQSEGAPRGAQGSAVPGSPGSQPGLEQGDGAAEPGGGNLGEAGDQPGQPGGSAAGQGTQAQRDGQLDRSQFEGRVQADTAPGFDNPSVSASDSTSQVLSGDAQVDYRDVYGEYRDQATRAMQNSSVPLGLKDLVKGYFSSLAPANK